jgi:hypothetical protein
MRIRMIKVGQRGRMMCRSNSIRDLVDAEDALIELGFIRVKFITFLKHIIRFRCKVKEDYYGIRLDDVVE